MSTSPAVAVTPRSTSAQLLTEFGGDPLSIEALLDFCTLAPAKLALLKELAAPEDWGDADSVLMKYLAVHVPLAIEQKRYVWNGKQIALRAGHLATERGAALYLGFDRAVGDRWELAWAGERPEKVEALVPADLGAWPELDVRTEVVVALDHFRAPELAGLPLVVQNAAVAGAAVWSLRRGLAVRQLRAHSRGYFVPIHLASREAAPDLVAPLQVQVGRLVIRALLEPRSVYAMARALVERREQLPSWLL